MPPLWQVPGAAVASAVENAAYGTRRDAVKRHVTRDEAALIADIDRGGGSALDEAMDAARIPVERRAQLAGELRNEPGVYRRRDDPGLLDIEAVTVALMVYGR